jgi:hypothetical protein
MSAKIGRNDSCPFGSGDKYKQRWGNTGEIVEGREAKGPAEAAEGELD